MIKKMTGKPAPVEPTSLDAFIGGADPVTAPQKQPSEPSKSSKGTAAAKSTKGRVGKPPMAAEEVRNRTIQIKVTENELEALKAKAGGVPVSSYLRDRLKEGEIL